MMAIELLRMLFTSFANIQRLNFLATGNLQLGEGGLGYTYDQNHQLTIKAFLTEFASPGMDSSGAQIEDPDIWKSIHGEWGHSIGVKADGSLWVTGYNSFGQLGLGDQNNRYVWTRVGTGNNWVKGCACTEHSSALKNDGTVWAWGRNDIAAAVGNGDIDPANVLEPYCVNTTPAPYSEFPETSKFIDLHSSHRLNLAMDQDREIWSWGNNGSRQLGRDYDPTYSPNYTQDRQIKRIDVDGPWKTFSGGAYHAGGIKMDGTLWMWGLNDSSQLGAGDTSSRLPRVVPSPVEGVKWAELYCGEYSTMALLEDGTLWAWGRNSNGQLGVGDTDTRSSPVQVPGVWRYAKAGYESSFGIKTDGTLWAWGNNNNGMIGLGSVSSVTEPTQVGTEDGWKVAYPMQYSAIALKE